MKSAGRVRISLSVFGLAIGYVGIFENSGLSFEIFIILLALSLILLFLAV